TSSLEISAWLGCTVALAMVPLFVVVWSRGGVVPPRGLIPNARRDERFRKEQGAVGGNDQSPADPPACRMAARAGTIDIRGQLPFRLSVESCPLTTLGLGAGDLGLMTLQPGSFLCSYLCSLPDQPPYQSSGWMCTSQPS